ncbi:hypothetical protein SCHPADRAFT_944981 [Schizopora paradoxa]|uniref:Protein kinase domain-containing protein n=1 Tax=Schizopora paradoxa TaxID=27342 RepID=A0A0H2R8R6_9AGAM|nr:hypothetical protein SCHPADRAFT_944981 [Schizopora paradoxa]
MLDFDNYRAAQIRLPQFGFPIPGCDPFDKAVVHKTYPESASPQKDLCEVTDFEEIRFEVTYGVCRAWIGPKDKSGSNSFIIKFAIGGSDERHKSLREEAAIYHEEIPSLQGIDVPTFYGYFEGATLGSDAERVSCIFLEDCGGPVYSSLVALPLSARAEILKKIGRIHLCGLTLDDFDEGNVVRRKKSYRIIDFQHVDFGHKCLWKGDRVYEGELVPTFSEIGCPIMHTYGLELDIWESRAPGSASFWIKSPEERIPNTLSKGVKFFHDDDVKNFHTWLKNYKQYEDSMTPEEYMEKFERPAFTRRYFGPRIFRPDQ